MANFWTAAPINLKFGIGTNCSTGNQNMNFDLYIDALIINYSLEMTTSTRLIQLI